MIETMKKRLALVSGREKTVMAITGFVTLTYIVYATFFQAQFAEIRLARKTLSGLDSTGRDAEEIRSRTKDKNMELEKTGKELGELEQKEKILSANLTARGYMGGVLKSMEESARKMSIQLLQLDSKTSAVSGKSRLLGAKGNSRKNADGAKSNYVRNVVKLKYRSQYPAGVDYFVKLLELPYAVSLLSFEISSSGARRGVLPDTTYSMEIEVYLK